MVTNTQTIQDRKIAERQDSDHKALQRGAFCDISAGSYQTMYYSWLPLWGVVLDPFFGSGTTGYVATETGRDFIGIEINEEYCKIAEERLKNVQMTMESIR